MFFKREYKYTQDELLYLQYYAAGFSALEIRQKLELDRDRVISIKKSIIRKTREPNWELIVIKMLKSSSVKRQFILNNSFLEKFCASSSKSILDKYFLNNSFQIKKNDLILSIRFFYHNYEMALKNKFKSTTLSSKLKNTEIDLLNNFLQKDWIDQQKDYTSLVKLLSNEKWAINLSHKLDACNWFCLVKKVAQYRLLSYPILSEKLLDREVKTSASRIIKIHLLNDVPVESVEQLINNELITFFINIEFLYLQDHFTQKDIFQRFKLGFKHLGKGT